jgi:23S rRNA (cytosine1962-C5)-methyltransferase
MSTPRVVLLPRRARPFYGRHPWVFAGAIASTDGQPGDGDEVEVHSHAGNFIARGLYNGRSKIRVRLYDWSPDSRLDESFFRRRITDAVRLRTEILNLTGPGKACRLVFSEGDGLSGLTVDQYDRWLVVQFTSFAMAERCELILNILSELVQFEGAYLRTERGIGQLEGLELHDRLLWGSAPDTPVIIEDGGLRFAANLAEGQKTGFYLDQRDNRRTVAHLAAGRRVLDAFCYTGGFGLHAARAGATSVVGVDSSAAALALAEENARLNSIANTSFVRKDVFEHLQALEQSGEQFGLVVLDPPKFARAKSSVEEALRGYRRLQSLALRILARDGIMVTCCCSGLITMDMLLALSGQLSVEENREIQIIDRRGQSADHPVAVTCLESNYLKCLIARVT